jgi:peptidoglycan/LPS O-acetylase OafA/YrhL
MDKRNAVVEFMRFIFAMWVVYYHSFIPFSAGGEFFNRGYLGVEFFFILSGALFFSSYGKFNGRPLIKGHYEFLWKKLKGLGLIYIIGLFFAIWYSVLAFGFNVWNIPLFFIGQGGLYGFLWFVPELLFVYAFMFILCRAAKKKKILIPLLGAIVLTCYALYYTVLKDNGLMRAFGGVSLGILVSFVPAFKLKLKNKFNLLTRLCLSVAVCAVIAMMIIPKRYDWQDFILVALFAAILYFAFQADIPKYKALGIVRNCFLYLGSLAFGLYALQCPLRILQYYGLAETTVLFAVLVTTAVLANAKSLQLFKRLQTAPADVST